MPPNDTIGELYELGSESFADKPTRIKYFREKNLKILDIEAGFRSLIVKCQNRAQEDDVSLYGFPFKNDQIDLDDEESRFAYMEKNAQQMLGKDSFITDNDGYGELVYRIGYDASKVLAFGCSQLCTFLLLKPTVQSSDHFEENKESNFAMMPSSAVMGDQGLIHYYRTD